MVFSGCSKTPPPPGELMLFRFILYDMSLGGHIKHTTYGNLFHMAGTDFLSHILPCVIIRQQEAAEVRGRGFSGLIRQPLGFLFRGGSVSKCIPRDSLCFRKLEVERRLSELSLCDTLLLTVETFSARAGLSWPIYHLYFFKISEMRRPEKWSSQVSRKLLLFLAQKR